MDIDEDSWRVPSEEIIVIKDLINETKNDHLKVNLLLNVSEKENFNKNLKSYLLVILENIYIINVDDNLIKQNALCYEKVFFDILELIIVEKFDFECECDKLTYFIYDSLKFLTLITINYREKDEFLFEYNFLITLEITIYYHSNRIQCEIKNIDIQYKIIESKEMKLNLCERFEIFISKNGLSKIYKHVNVKRYLNSNQKLKFISMFNNKNKKIILFNDLIREILIIKGLEPSHDRIYTNCLF